MKIMLWKARENLLLPAVDLRGRPLDLPPDLPPLVLLLRFSSSLGSSSSSSSSSAKSSSSISSSSAEASIQSDSSGSIRNFNIRFAASSLEPFRSSDRISQILFNCFKSIFFMESNFFLYSEESFSNSKPANERKFFLTTLFLPCEPKHIYGKKTNNKLI